MGGVWSTADNSPETNEDGKNNFRGYRSRSGHRMILDDTDKTKVVIADKTGKNMVGVGNFATAGAGPNVCAVYKPPMAGDTGVSISSMEGTMEITCKDGTLSIEADAGNDQDQHAHDSRDEDRAATSRWKAARRRSSRRARRRNLDASTINIA